MTASTLELSEDELMLGTFRFENSDLFQKNDKQLYLHLGIVLSGLWISVFFSMIVPWLAAKIFFSIVTAFFLFCLINVTIHHHHTHHNAAKSELAKKILNLLYCLIVPNAARRLFRYSRAHLNHHFYPFGESDVDHHYGLQRFIQMKKSLWTKIVYFAELTFVGAHMPGWEDYHYMNRIPIEEWNQKDYLHVKKVELGEAKKLACIQWALFFVVLYFVPVLAWGWVLPMLLVKNWAHFFGQFQHYDEHFTDVSKNSYQRTKTFNIPGWLNYLSAGELTSHLIHHLYPEIPYYHLPETIRRFRLDEKLSGKFLVS